MTLRTRLEKLEEARPAKDADLSILCRSIVRRDGNGLLWEKPFLVTLVRQPAAPNETLQRHESESQAAFVARVRDALRLIDPTEAEAFEWTFGPSTHHTE